MICVEKTCCEDAVNSFQLVDMALPLCWLHKRAIYGALGQPALFEDAVVVNMDVQIGHEVLQDFVQKAIKNEVTRIRDRAKGTMQ